MADKEHKDIDAVTGTDTTGHEWDGIKELNTPLPKWWLYTFYATCVWALVYTVFYPAWPMLTTATAGILGHTNRGALHEALAAHVESQKVYTDRIAAMDPGEIASDAELMQFAQSGGAAIFRTYCSQCHGAGAAGVQASGYPNLLDDDWIWGGSREAIVQTITHGIRYEGDDETRLGEMPAFGTDWLEPAQIDAVVQHVRSLSGLAEPNADGAEVFANECSSCHGEDGKGMAELGAPNLTDAIWLYGSEPETVRLTVANGRGGVMPAWSDRLSEAQIKQVALYVHSLGGGTQD